MLTDIKIWLRNWFCLTQKKTRKGDISLAELSQFWFSEVQRFLEKRELLWKTRGVKSKEKRMCKKKIIKLEMKYASVPVKLELGLLFLSSAVGKEKTTMLSQQHICGTLETFE